VQTKRSYYGPEANKPKQSAGMLQALSKSGGSGGPMTAATSNRYDPWYVKAAFGLFVGLIVGFLTVLHYAPNSIVE
jgi:hypothetical protein